MILPGSTKELTSVLTYATDNTPVISGTVYVFAWLEHSIDGYAGLFWDGAAWTAGISTVPEATYIKGGVWAYDLPGSASTSYSGSTVHWIMADAEDDASISTVCSAQEQLILNLTPASIADAVWDEPQAGHTTPTTFGAMESNIRGADGDDLKDVTDKIELIPSADEIAFVTWDIGENITTRLFVSDPDTGNGLINQEAYITLTFQRASDSKYWSGTAWQTASYNLSMTALDEGAQPGVYVYVLSGSTGNTQKDSYVAYATVNNPGVVEGQNFECHASRTPPTVVSRLYESEPN
jgi:hypothetical protein